MRYIILVCLFLSTSFMAAANDWQEATKNFKRSEGMLTVYTDASTARVRLLLPAPNEHGVAGRFLYTTYLTAGLGSNPVGLDRNSGRGTEIISFKRAGDKMIVIAENTRFRASSDNVFEQQAVKRSFAQSALWSAKILATEPETGNILIDITSFLTQDVGIAAQLSGANQGNFSLSADLSYVNVGATLAFPKNLEFDSTLTFQSSRPGGEVRATTPVPNNVTLMSHVTLMELPDDGYKPRLNDVRLGAFSASFIDMSAPLGESVVKRLAIRHRLEKIDPTAKRSKVKEPIVYYVDNGAPEPIRSALIEGASWWADAFDAAGFIDAFQVKVLPDDVHPLDIRYNIISWVHRATRGWSYGDSIIDPRTGELLRGNVTLGSLRLRQDIKIFEGLAGAQKTGSGDKDDPIELALARVRQLSAHEVGHTLGFGHNMGSSSLGVRSSVMDYPSPWVHVGANETLDFSDAYAVGLGAWDLWTVKFLYGEYAPGVDEATGQKALVKEADEAGLVFVSDRDSRFLSGAHWRGNVWDNGSDPIESLKEVIAVRRIALNKFGINNLRDGEAHGVLQDKIVPVYLYHRYQIDATAKMIGGMDFSYNVKNDGRPASTLVSPKDQMAALDTILDALNPEVLKLSENVLRLLSPMADSDGDPQFDREVFGSSIGPAFDYLNAVSVASDMPLRAILHPARLGRLVSFKARNPEQLGLDAVLSRMVARIFKNHSVETKQDMALQRVVQNRTIAAFLETLNNENIQADVRMIMESHVNDLAGWLEKARAKDNETQWAYAMMARDIRRYQARPVDALKTVPPAVTAPPGSPIGAGEPCWHCYQ